MNDKRAKRARRYARALIGAKPNENGAVDWADAWLHVFITPKQRRRAEALAVRKSQKHGGTGTHRAAEAAGP